MKTKCHLTYLPHAQRGFSLVEVLIALALGMLVISAALGIFLANRKTSEITRALGQLQENQRLVFSLLSADLRRAGDYPCASFSKRKDNNGNDPLVYLMNPPYLDLNPHRDGLRGSTTNAMDSVALYMYNASGASGYQQLDEVAGYATEITQNTGQIGPGVRSGHFGHVYPPGFAVTCNADVAMVYDLNNRERCSKYFSRQGCNQPGLRYCFWASNFNTQPNRINHPDQFSAQYSSDCDEFGRSAAFSFGIQYLKVDWYVAENGRGGNSLYRHYVYPHNLGGGEYEPREKTEEIIAGVSHLQLRYHVRGQQTYQPAHNINDDQWPNVDTVHIKITFQPTTLDGLGQIDIQGTNGEPLSRDMEAYITVRNHVPYVI